MNIAVNKIIRINYRLTLGFLRQPNLRAGTTKSELKSPWVLAVPSNTARVSD